MTGYKAQQTDIGKAEGTQLLFLSNRVNLLRGIRI